jgi:fused signal recognition particle receptor
MTAGEAPGLWRRLSAGLSRTASKLGAGIASLSHRKLDAETLQRLEDLLIEADLGVDAAARVVQQVGRVPLDPDSNEQVQMKERVTGVIESILTPVEHAFVLPACKPAVVLVVGVNGSGKTTTIGKLAARLKAEGNIVLIAAADTFRAAAIEQLVKWGERTGTHVIARAAGADPAGVAFEAIERARTENADVLIIDTAGRLQNKQALMAELEKIVRVVKKLDSGAPHAVLLVLDATVGQNTLSQVEAFAKSAGVTGLVIAKLDGTAKGGILVAVAERFRLPVHFIGVGEAIDDLMPFSARDFARALVGLGSSA